MRLTYKPYIRESLSKDFVINNPVIDIIGYKPKYNIGDSDDKLDNVEDDALPVKSDIKEISMTMSNNRKPFKFSSKKEFTDTMTPIYETILNKRGINPIFAKALVVQDGLESA